jgi:hypothetical protein
MAQIYRDSVQHIETYTGVHGSAECVEARFQSQRRRLFQCRGWLPQVVRYSGTEVVVKLDTGEEIFSRRIREWGRFVREYHNADERLDKAFEDARTAAEAYGMFENFGGLYAGIEPLLFDKTSLCDD